MLPGGASIGDCDAAPFHCAPVPNTGTAHFLCPRQESVFIAREYWVLNVCSAGPFQLGSAARERLRSIAVGFPSSNFQIGSLCRRSAKHQRRPHYPITK